MKHGLDNTAICRTWRRIKERCLNKKSKDYANYGKRGITVCELIIKTPQSLLDLIGERPVGKTIDRIDNDSGYSCGKCNECKNKGWEFNLRWASPLEQVRNRKITKKVNINGEDIFLQDVAKKIGVTYNTILRRFDGKFKTSLFSTSRNAPRLLANRVFGNLKVLKNDSKKNGYRMWICLCKCGNRTSVREGNLLSGNSTSCSRLCGMKLKKAKTKASAE